MLAPGAWADESHRLARAVYRELDEHPEERGMRRLPADHAAAQRARVAEALAKAGVRLAALLDRIAAEREAGRGGR